MKGPLRIVVADMWSILSGVRGILLLLALPAIVLFAVGHLRSRVEVYTLGIAGLPEEPAAAKQLAAGLELWNQLSVLRVVQFDAPAVDPRTMIEAQHLDLLLNIGDAGTRCWRMYSAETSPVRALAARQVGASLERSLLLVAARRNETSALRCDKPVEQATAAATGSAGQAKDTSAPFLDALTGFGALPPSMLSTYYPATLTRRITMLPMTVAAMLCFVPFVIGVSSLIKEKEAHTLEVLLSAPDINGWGLFAAKASLPIAITAFHFLMMVVLVDSLFGLHTKGSFGLALLAISPGIISAALLGVAASTLVSSQTQAVMASALYFGAQTLFTGFVTPLTGASPLVLALSRFLPLSFVMPSLDAWFLGAGPRTYGGVWVAVQLIASATVAVAAYRRFLRNL